MRSRTDRRAAYHEAGHAVARVVLGFGATAVSIEHDGSGNTHGTGQVYRDHGAITSRIQVALAGPVAEARYARQSLSAIWIGSGSGDLASATEMLAALGIVDAQQMDQSWDAFVQATGQLVRTQWVAIAAVAEALVERRALSADEVRAAVETATEPA